MPQTYDFDHVGKTQFFTQLWGADEDSPFAECFVSEYVNSKTAAEKLLRETFKTVRSKWPNAIWGEIRKGEWRDTSFEDPGYGWIRDATFDDEDQLRAYAYPSAPSGALKIDWEDPG